MLRGLRRCASGYALGVCFEGSYFSTNACTRQSLLHRTRCRPTSECNQSATREILLQHNITALQAIEYVTPSENRIEMFWPSPMLFPESLGSQLLSSVDNSWSATQDTRTDFPDATWSYLKLPLNLPAWTDKPIPVNWSYEPQSLAKNLSLDNINIDNIDGW